MTGRKPDHLAAGNGSRGSCRVFGCSQVRPMFRVIRCGAVPLAAFIPSRVPSQGPGAHGAGPRQRAVRRDQSQRRPAAQARGAE